jgi:hypothetical protein
VADQAGDQARASSRPRGGSLWAVLGLIPAVAVATWWAIGDLSFHAPNDPVLSQEWSQPRVAPAVQTGLGITGSLLVVICLATLVRTRRTFDGLWWAVVGGVAVVGVLAGLVERVATAGLVASNIGGDLAVLVGLPVLGLVAVGLVALAIVLSTGARTGA